MKSPKSMRSVAGSAKASTGEAQANQPDGGQGAESLLKADHRAVEALFEKYKAAGSAAQKADLAKQVCTQLIVHATLEEEIFYPACREKNVENDMMNEAQVEHDGAKILIAELVAQSPDDEFYDAKVTVLSEYIKHHVGEEEKPSDGIFAKARQAGVDMSALGQRLQTRRQELMAKAKADGLPPSMPRSRRSGPLRQRRRRPWLFSRQPGTFPGPRPRRAGPFHER
jgi:Hemerythrin HHE cation binding domain